jgi:ribonuclease VapC
MFLDASSIVSILTLEEGHDHLARRIEEAGSPITSAIAIYEATLAVARKKRVAIDRAMQDVEAFLQRLEARVMPIDPGAAQGALVA